MNDHNVLEVSEKLSESWKKVLALNDTSQKDNFFAMGGHSLLALELLSEIEEKFNVRLNMKNIIEAPTILELSLLIAQQKKTENSLESSSSLEEAHYPLTTNQKQIWSLNALYPESLSHNISTLIRIRKKLDSDIVTKTLNTIVERQEVLRSRFVVHQGVPRQVFVPSYHYEVKFTPIIECELKADVQRELKHCFNLEHDQLMRVKFYKLKEDEFIFLFMVHHIIWDGLSNILFFHEFNEIYESYSSGKAPNLSPLRMTYKDYALKEQAFFETHDFFNQKNEWKDLLSGLEGTLNLPVDFERQEKIRTDSHTVYFHLDQKDLEEVEQFAQERFVSLYNIFFTVYKITLAKITGDLDLVVGTPVHGRHLRETRKTFGYFINSLPVRSRLNSEGSFKENLGIVLESLKNSFYNQQVPFETIIQSVDIPPHFGTTPLFQTLFVYLDVTKELDVFKEMGYEQVKAERSDAYTEMDFYLYKSREKVEGAFEFRKDLFKPQTIEAFGEVFKDILQQVIQNEYITLKELGIQPSGSERIKSAGTSEIKIDSFSYHSPTIDEVKNIWKEVLGIQEIDPDAHFFSLGGHSVMAVEIFGLINEKFKLNLSMGTLFEASTIKRLSYLIDRESGRTQKKLLQVSGLKSIVTIKPGHDEAEAIFCIHGIGGNVLNYHRLIEAMGDKALYGVQALGVNGLDQPLESIHEMARFYMKEIRQVQPKGPYILAGGSMGGLIALEVAKLLKDTGEEIKTLLMFDTFGPNFNWRKYGWERSSLKERLMMAIKEKPKRWFKELRLFYYSKTGKTLPHSIRYFYVESKNGKALRAYRPNRYDGDLTLIRAPYKERGWYADPDLGWRGVIGGEIRTIVVDGDHQNMIETPELSQVMRKLVGNL